MSLSALITVVASGEAQMAEESAHVSPYVYGAATLIVFLVLLYGTTRLNLDR